VNRAEHVYLEYLTPSSLVRGGTIDPTWIDDGERLLYTRNDAEQAAVICVDLRTGAETLRTGAAKSAEEVDPFKKVLGWSPASGERIRTWNRVDYLSVKLEVPEQVSPSGEWFACVRQHNLALRSAWDRESPERRLTSDGTPDRYWDIEAARLKVSSGRRVSFNSVDPWSPDSLMLLAYRRDTMGVARIPRVHWLKPFIDVEYLVWPMAGAQLDRIEPVFIDARGGRQVPVHGLEITGRYIQLLGWHPRGKDALIISYTRDFKRVEIIAADRESGESRSVLSEAYATFVKIWHDAIFAGDHGFRMLANGNGFIWASTRDGWNHLYHYEMNGRLAGQLTKGEWPVHEIKHIDAHGMVYFTASPDQARPYDVHVCRVSLREGIVERLTHEQGIHAPVFAPSGLAFLDTHSSVTRPIRTDVVRADGTLLRTIAQMDISRLQAVGYTPAEEFTVAAADGATELWGVLYKPFDFDPGRSYPVIEYIYGGPQTIETPRYFAMDPTAISSMRLAWALAQLGYIVVCLDARGTPGRSKQFQDAIYGNWTVGLADHANAIQQLCKRFPWMDRHRIGITGHSWGGYFSTCALIQEPETYLAAVSYAPHYDPWDGMLSEPYLGLPLENRVPYDEASLYARADSIRGQLLIVTGTSDNGFSTVMKMTRALIDAGVDHELAVIPSGYHFFSGTEEQYFLKKLTGWFGRHVKNRAVGA
jgi:dipeptidyl aminopeptidase/acylaminoacyl peptidase